MNLKNWIIIIVAVMAIGFGAFFLTQRQNQPSKLDDFAKCLKDKGVIFYGTFWCPHCQNQKELFGSSAKYLPYVECSTSDSNGQLEVCNQAKVQGYPTWQFSDGLRQEGGMNLKELSDKSGCQLPK